MAVIKGTERSPAMPVESPIDGKRINEEEKRTYRRSYEERLKVYEDYLKTEEGQAALALAEHERKRIDYLLSLPSWQHQMTPEQMAEYRLILVGERRVWTFLLTEPDRLKRELNQLEGKEEEDDGKPKWRVVKKGLDFFGGKPVNSQTTNAASPA